MLIGESIGDFLHDPFGLSQFVLTQRFTKQLRLSSRLGNSRLKYVDKRRPTDPDAKADECIHCMSGAYSGYSSHHSNYKCTDSIASNNSDGILCSDFKLILTEEFR